jgi:hypothetical protein
MEATRQLQLQGFVLVGQRASDRTCVDTGLSHNEYYGCGRNLTGDDATDHLHSELGARACRRPEHMQRI